MSVDWLAITSARARIRAGQPLRAQIVSNCVDPRPREHFLRRSHVWTSVGVFLV